jgi:hypothetical protein
MIEITRCQQFLFGNNFESNERHKIYYDRRPRNTSTSFLFGNFKMKHYAGLTNYSNCGFVGLRCVIDRTDKFYTHLGQNKLEV